MMGFLKPSLAGSIVLLAALVSSSPSRGWTSVDKVLAGVINGSSESITTSLQYGLDGPKIKSINSTSWEWWYFDVVSEDAKSSATVVFYTAPDTGFVFAQAPTDNILEVSLALTVPGSDVDPVSLYITNFAEKATIVTTGNGASGEWTGTGFRFAGSPDMREYIITIDDENNGVKGTIIYQSVAPAHYPCGCVEAGQPLEILPTIGWSNAVPDAHTRVDLTINGTSVKFTGAGYHDKNWGTQPFTDVVGSWYWGHGRLGPYSIVWFDALSPNGTESVSAYVSLNGQPIVSACSGIKVRPLGNARYPPHAGDPSPSGFSVEIDLGSKHGGLLVMNATTEVPLLAVGLYNQYTGKLSGGIQGHEQLSGSAQYEEFQLFE